MSDYFGRYIDNWLGTASCSRVKLERLFTFLMISTQLSNSHGRLVFPSWIFLYRYVVTHWSSLCSTSPPTSMATTYPPPFTLAILKIVFPTLNFFDFNADLEARSVENENFFVCPESLSRPYLRPSKLPSKLPVPHLRPSKLPVPQIPIAYLCLAFVIRLPLSLITP